MVAEHLRLVGQVVRVDPDAVAADQARLEAEEVPLRAGGRRGLPAVSSPSRSKMIASSFIKAMFRSRCVFSITLHASAAMMLLQRCTPGSTIVVVEIARPCRASPGYPGDHLDDIGQPVLAVPRVDAFRAVADEEVLLPDEPRGTLERRDADLLGGARVDGRFVDDGGARLQGAARWSRSRRAGGGSPGCARCLPASERQPG